jgi:hypothetical protein
MKPNSTDFRVDAELAAREEGRQRPRVRRKNVF